MIQTVRNTDDIFKIIQLDDPLLRETSAPVEIFDQYLADFVEKLKRTMILSNGRGISAIQVGVRQRILIAAPQGKPSQTYIMINPVITRTLNRFTTEREGCLSIPPRLWRDVKRPAKCEITWQDLEGHQHSENLSGEAARIVQHEYDHLDGILIIDKE